MTRFAHDALCSEDSDITGAVFTHGTNSLEETTFLMDALVNCGKPVVGTGAMRPWTDMSYDGDANFFQAVTLAANENSKNRGALAAFNDRILSGFWITKLTPNVPDAFGVTAVGKLGAFLNNLQYFYNR
jgi:L-asparaginase